MADQTLDAAPDAAPATPAPTKRIFEARALEPSSAFWFTMFAASALGANVGDFWAETLGLGLAASFVTLAAICALLIWGDRENGARNETFYWLAIVALRAVATNVGDLLTHPLGMNYAVAAALLAAATLVAGRFTRPGPGGASPLIDLRYWLAMFIGGVFGTVGGDLVAHGVGLFFATLLLGLALLAVIRARNLAAPTAMVGYWCVVLAERAAGTPAGDWLAKGHGVGLGLILSMIITCALVLAGLAARRGRVDWPAIGAPSLPITVAQVAIPVLRLVLLALSILGCYFMAQIYFVQRPRDPSFVLSYAAGLGANALYLGWQEVAGLGSSRLARLASLWFAAKRREFDRWADAKEAELRQRVE